MTHSYMPDQQKFDLMVIMVNYNGSDDLKRLMPGLTRNLEGLNGCACLVDNASDDDSLEWIKANYPHVIVMPNETNLGFARANNRALSILPARYHLLLNTDVEFVSDRTLFKCLQFMESQPEIGMMGCILLNEDLTVQRSTYRYPSFLGLVTRALGVKVVVKRLISIGDKWGLPVLNPSSQESHYSVDVVKGAFCMVRADALDKVGMLDETTFMYGEEADWAYRFRRAGWEVHYYLGAQVIHHGGSHRRASVLEIEKLRGQFNFIRKHRSSVQMRIVALIFAAAYFARVLMEILRKKMRDVTVEDNYSLRPVARFCWCVFRSGDIHAMRNPNLPKRRG